MYFIGGSTGGREALKVAQRFPADYDGVLAAYAVWDQVELDLQFIRTAQALYAPGGFLGHTQTTLIQHTVLRACDANDGLRDGIVSDPAACHVDPATLRCKDGHAHHGCLSDAQLHTLITFATPQRTTVALSDGVDSIPGYNVLSGAPLNHATGFLPFPLHNPVFIFNGFGYVIGDDILRNFFTVGYHYDARNFDTSTGGQWHNELLHQAHEIDSTSVDLRIFAAHGGKLILVHGTTDNIVPTNSSVDYYQRLRTTMGADATARFARLYLIPGLGHGFGLFNAGFDTIGVLDAWADKNITPENLIVTDNHNGRTRPLCDWPTYARYNSGDPNLAISFTCMQP
jgi:feruloyl esterase